MKLLLFTTEPPYVIICEADDKNPMKIINKELHGLGEKTVLPWNPAWTFITNRNSEIEDLPTNVMGSIIFNGKDNDVIRGNAVLVKTDYNQGNRIAGFNDNEIKEILCGLESVMKMVIETREKEKAEQNPVERAIIIGSDAEVATIDISNKSQRLKIYQNAVDGLIDFIPLNNSKLGLIINDNGKFDNLPRNDVATAVAYGTIAEHDYIAGNAILVKNTEEFDGFTEDELEGLNLTLNILKA